MSRSCTLTPLPPSANAGAAADTTTRAEAISARLPVADNVILIWPAGADEEHDASACYASLPVSGLGPVKSLGTRSTHSVY